MPSLDQFRKRVLQYSLFSPRALKPALKRLGFVQADPIRSPARAQDLILRHRVKNYRAGDLERSYPNLNLEECFLYAYGFASDELWRIVHPSTDTPLTMAEQKALALIKQHGPMHPKDLEAQIGAKRAQNCWGGFSRTAKLALEALHDRGALRVAHRVKGIRVYELADGFEQHLSKEERFKEIVVATLQAMGATTRTFLLKELAHFDNLVKQANTRRRCLQDLIDSGRLRLDLVDSVEYISLDGQINGRRNPDGVQILAPFDPIVRDRARFEHLWGWTYRFEAYTPKAKRKMGYYAMPVLWRDKIVGWANVAVEGDQLRASFGYVAERPSNKAFFAAAESEIRSMAEFLGLREGSFTASI